MHGSLLAEHQGHRTHLHPLAWHLWCQRCQHWLKIYMGSPHTPAGVTQESVEREGWMTNNKTAQRRSEWELILGAVKNRKGREKGKQLTESTVGRGRHTVRGKGTISQLFLSTFTIHYSTWAEGGKKNTGWDQMLRACTARWGQREWNFVWMLLYGKLPSSHNTQSNVHNTCWKCEWMGVLFRKTLLSKNTSRV